MFEPAALVRAGVRDGLVFLDTDHGYALAAGSARLAVARRRGDALDWMAWDAFGRPPAFAYDFRWDRASATPEVLPLAFDAPPAPSGPARPLPASARRIEGESLWPAVDQAGGWALPAHAGGTCASAGRWLALHTGSRPVEGVRPANEGQPGGSTDASVDLALPAPWLRGRRVTLVFASAADPSIAPDGSAPASASATQAVAIGDGVESARAGFAGSDSAPSEPPSAPVPSGAPRCWSLNPLEIPGHITRLAIRVTWPRAGPAKLVALDRIEILDE